MNIEIAIFNAACEDGNGFVGQRRQSQEFFIVTMKKVIPQFTMLKQQNVGNFGGSSSNGILFREKKL